MLNSSSIDVSEHYRPDGTAGWGGGGYGDGFPPPWFQVRLMFGDGASVDVLAVVADGRMPAPDPYARPPISLDDFAAPAEAAAPAAPAAPVEVIDPLVEDIANHPQEPPAPSRRARPSWPRGAEGRRTVAEEYRAAQREGRDPVLAVMCATGRSRRKSLKLIAASRDAGFLPPRHNRR